MHRCDIGNDHSTATKFCVDCGKKMCKAHTESHQHFFEAAHKTIDIRTYAKRPDYYLQAYCEDHPNNTIENVCMKCYRIPCRYCTSGACQAGVSHIFQPLEDIRAPIQAEFDDLVKKCSGKIAELCNLEKQTWRTVDDLNEKCEAMINQVEETTKEQVADIMQKQDDLKQEIRDYREDCLAKVGTYTAKFIEEVAEIEREQMSVQHFLHENHTAKVVKDRAANVKELKNISNSVTTSFELEKQSERTLIHTAACREVELKFAPLVTLHRSLTYMCDTTMPEGAYCRSLAHSEETKLVVGCSEYVSVCNITTSDMNSIRIKFELVVIKSIDLLRELSQICFLASSGAVYSLPIDLSSRTKLIYDESLVKGRLCVSGKYVVGVNTWSSRVIVYNTETKIKQSYNLAEDAGGQIRSISAAPGDSVVTLDGNKGIVRCYQLHENTTPTMRWSCAGISGGYAICVDENGVVYVSGKGKLYILLEGTLVNTLECPQLPAHEESSEFSDISVYGNCLVSTQHQSKIVRRFRLE